MRVPVGRSVRMLRQGERGLILLDGAQRLYAPELGARGTVIATFDQAMFTRPDGTVDRGGIELVRRGVVRR